MRRGNHVRNIVIAQPARLSCELGGRGCRRPLSSGGACSRQTAQSVRSASTFRGAVLVDLRRRIARDAVARPTRLSAIDRRACSSRSFGSSCATGEPDYDWRKAEAKLNALPQFMTTIDGRRHPLHPRPLAASECPAADHHARLAGLGHRAAQDHRSAHRSDRARRRRGGRLRRRASRRCPATASPASRPAPAGIPTASRAPGRS